MLKLILKCLLDPEIHTYTSKSVCRFILESVGRKATLHRVHVSEATRCSVSFPSVRQEWSDLCDGPDNSHKLTLLRPGVTVAVKFRVRASLSCWIALNLALRHA